MSLGMKVLKFYCILMFKCPSSQGPTQGPPPRGVVWYKDFVPHLSDIPQKTELWNMSSPWSFQLEVMDPWLLLAPSSSSIQPYLQSSPPHTPHSPIPSLSRQIDWVSYHTDIRESLGAMLHLPQPQVQCSDSWVRILLFS